MIINEEIGETKWQISQFDEHEIMIFKDGEQFKRIRTQKKVSQQELEKILHLYQLEIY